MGDILGEKSRKFRATVTPGPNHRHLVPRRWGHSPYSLRDESRSWLGRPRTAAVTISHSTTHVTDQFQPSVTPRQHWGMEFDEVIRKRRMVRNYAPEPVPPETLDRIVDAGLSGPSAGYSQGVGFVIVTDEGTRNAIGTRR